MPTLHAEISANAEQSARVKAKTPVIQGNSKWHATCDISSAEVKTNENNFERKERQVS